MNRSAPITAGHDGSWIHALTHLVIWASLAGACLLFAWFVAVLHDTTERGDQKRLQQRASMLLQTSVFSETKVGNVR